MKRQRGFAWWIYLAAAGAALGVLWLAIERFDSWVDGIKAEAKAEGRKDALLEVARRDNEQLVAAQAEIQRLTNLVRTREADHAAAIAALDKEKTREVRDAENRKERFVADVVAGRIRLFDPGRRAEACAGGGGGAPTTALAGAGVDHGAEGGRLSDEAAIFLSRLAGEADQVVLQLQACQAILVEDRKVCR